MAKAVTVARTGRPLILDFALSEDDWRLIGNAVAQDMSDNVMRQQTALGQPLKVNAPSTQARKRRLGRPLKSLIDNPRTHRFVLRRDYHVVPAWRDGKPGVEIGPGDQMVSRYVQQKGYVGWIAPSKVGLAAVRRVVAAAIERARAKASRHKSKK